MLRRFKRSQETTAAVQAIIVVSILCVGVIAAGVRQPKQEQPSSSGQTEQEQNSQDSTDRNEIDHRDAERDENHRRIANFPVLRGRVVDATTGKPVAGVDVSRRWEAFDGDYRPALGWAVTDARGEFELPMTQLRFPVAVLAFDEQRRRGGLAIVKSLDGLDLHEDVQQSPEIKVEIQLDSLIEIQGGYHTLLTGRRPRRVWTSIQLEDRGPTILEENESQDFLYRLPKGHYLLRGSSMGFEDVYRELDLSSVDGTLELVDLELPVAKLTTLYGQPAPDWQITDARGIETSTKLSDYHGKWVVLEFWGHWCGPCIDHMDQLFRFSKQHQEDRDKFKILTVHHRGAETIEELAEKMPPLLKQWDRDYFPYPVVIDTTNETVQSFGVDRFPTTIFINPKGNVEYVNGGIWSLSKILQGEEVETYEYFTTRQPDAQRQPLTVKSSNFDGGVKSDRFVSLNGHTDMVADVAFLPDGNEFVTASSDCTLRFWSVETLQETRQIKCSPKGKSWSSYGGIQLFISPETKDVGSLFYQRHNGKFLYFPSLWKANTNYEESVAWFDPESHFSEPAISPDGSQLAAYVYHADSSREEVRIFDLQQQGVVHVLNVHGDREKGGRTSADVKYSPDGRILAVAGDKGKSLQVWDVKTGEMNWEAHPEDAYGVNSISFSPDGEFLAAATWHEPLEIRSTETGQLIKTLRHKGHRPVCVSYSPTGRYLAIGDISAPMAIRIWDSHSDRVVLTLTGHPTGRPPAAIAWSPDSLHLVSVAGDIPNVPGEVLLWDLSQAGFQVTP